MYIPESLLRDAHDALDYALADSPDISPHGWRVMGDSSDWSEANLPGIATALAFICHGPVERCARVRSSSDSYAFKHHAEDWGGALGLAPYIANGEFIRAALYLHVPLGRARGPNCCIGLRLLRKNPYLPRRGDAKVSARFDAALRR